ncbi:MAG: hypothetical protein LBU32_01765, partial [Clostridiales bacterium]|nr:hypothetical protein [Clostridiales bacterium]
MKYFARHGGIFQTASRIGTQPAAIQILAGKGRIWKGRDRQRPRRADAGERAVNGRKGKPPMIIAGSRSAENADAAEIKGRDGVKLISGAEIHIAAGALGLPSAVGAAPANASGRSGALLIIGRESADLKDSVETALADGGNAGADFAA